MWTSRSRASGRADFVAPQRAHPQKYDCFVLDFQNNSAAITFAFQDYYRTTLLAEETDPNKLHDLKAALDAAQVYSPEQVQQVVGLFLGARTATSSTQSSMRAWRSMWTGSTRTARWTSGQGQGVLPHLQLPFVSNSLQQRGVGEALDPAQSADAKLPAPQEEDLSKGILEAIDMDSYPRREEGGDEDGAGGQGR